MTSAVSINGILNAFSDQGTEGIFWTVYDPAFDHANGQRDIKGLTTIENGDLLRVFNDENRAELLWEGPVDLDYTSDIQGHPVYPQIQTQRIEGYSVHGVPRVISPEQWLRAFFEEKPCELVKTDTPANPAP